MTRRTNRPDKKETQPKRTTTERRGSTRLHETDFIAGDIYNNPFFCTLATYDDIGSAIDSKNFGDDVVDLHYNFAILNIPASLIVFDLIELLKSIPGFSTLSSRSAEENSQTPSRSFRMLRVQMGMQLDEPVEGNQGADRYFALVCIHVDRARLQSRRKSTLTVKEVADMLMSSIRSAVENQEFLFTKGVCSRAAEVSVELAVSCRPTEERQYDENTTVVEGFLRPIELPTGGVGVCEDSACPICLEPYGRFEIITFVCLHSFHFHCIGEHILSRCPLCRLPIPVPYVRDCYQLQNPVSSTHRCSECGRADDRSAHLLLCLVCGYVACPVHSLNHFESTSHGYGIELWSSGNEDSSDGAVAARGLPTIRGQRIWNHRTNCWVQQLVSSSNGMQFVELVSDSKPLPEQDPDCCQQLNALCAQFMRSLSHTIDSRAELFQQRVSAIKNEHSVRMKTLRAEIEKRRALLSRYESARQDVDAKINEVNTELQSVKEENSATQSAMKVVDEQMRQCDRETFSVRRALFAQKQTMSDLSFHASARSRIMRASNGQIGTETELEGGDVIVRDGVNSESQPNREKRRPRRS